MALAEPKTLLLFVYGSLKQGGFFHSYLEDACLLGEAESLTCFRIGKIEDEENSEDYPIAYVCDAADSVTISGEIYEITAEMLENIDKLEEYPEEYDRRVFEFELESGKKVQALMYCGHEEP